MSTDSQTVEGGRWRTAVAAVLGLYAVGLVLAEAVLQAGAILATALALTLAVTKRLRLEQDVRAFVVASVALCLWQLLSPAVALATGAATKWPRGARYGQALDTVAGAAVACIGTLGVPWVLLGGIVVGGWLLATALGLFQHRVRWPWVPPSFTKLNLSRLHENFGTEESPRYASGGFFFHRLRFAHGAIAVLGPALAVLGRSRVTRQRVMAGAVVLGLLLSIYGAFARAALGAALGVCVLALLLLLRGTARKAGLGVAVALVVLVLLTPAWRERFGKAVDNLFGSGERSLAMSVGWRLVKEHPWVGVGFGNHKPAALATQAQTGITDLLATDAHNLWLTAWAETGLVGLVLLAAMHGLLARALVRRHRQGSLIATGALLSFVGFHVLALVHYLPFHPSVHLSFMLVWGLGLCRWAEAEA
ncbi:O-antigen ligase domain-containing protein [Corallococcus sp. ZKHCc1 1396]|uniref:O-antigen ligase domain-containing protein n=2 Tax=Corallococcus soli TaxID=2710757 RepID=A0ABR9PVG7_9BACT|nr:O-antigen ligase family protein [Corallococcus soli]MBE4751928.1 O-antigen ligase domain-containing protein [Corallococcus soli]